MHEVDTELIGRTGIPSVRRAHSHSQSEAEPERGGQPGASGVPKILVDSREACAKESGEIIDAGLGGDELVELGELVRFLDDGKVDQSPCELGAPWHQRAVIDSQRVDALRSGEVTMFKSVGVGAMDAAIACAVVDKASEMGIGIGVEGF